MARPLQIVVEHPLRMVVGHPLCIVVAHPLHDAEDAKAEKSLPEDPAKSVFVNGRCCRIHRRRCHSVLTVVATAVGVR